MAIDFTLSPDEEALRSSEGRWTVGTVTGRDHFGIAEQYGGRCNLRSDGTNPG